MSKKIAFNSEYDEAAGNRNLLDHRSTGTSPGENQEPEIQVRKIPENIADYVDFTSPILKHLIEIEKKFWRSDTNDRFQMVRISPVDDDEESIKSLQGVTKYDLVKQNAKIERKSRSRSKEDKGQYKTVGNNLKKAQKKTFLSRERSFNTSQREGSLDSFRKIQKFDPVKSDNQRNHNLQVIKFKPLGADIKLTKRIKLSPRQYRKQSPNQAGNHQFSLEKNFNVLNAKIDRSSVGRSEKSPLKSHSKKDSINRKSTVRDTVVSRATSRQRLRQITPRQKPESFFDSRQNLNPNVYKPGNIFKSFLKKDASQNSKNHLENSKIENGKNFLKKFKELFNNRRDDLSKRKTQGQSSKKNMSKIIPVGISTSHRLMNRLKNIPETQTSQTSKNARVPATSGSKSILKRIRSDFVGKPNYVSRVQENTSATSKEKERPISNPRQPAESVKSKNQTRKSQPATRSSKSILRQQFSTYNQMPYTPMTFETSAVKSKSRESSKKRGTKSSIRARVMGRSIDLKKSALYNKSIDQLKKEVLDKKRASDKLKIAEIEQKIYTSTFKHRILNKIFTSGVSALRTRES